MTPWALFLTSFIVALTGALMPGPVLAVTIRDSARRGAAVGPLIILGHGILEIGLIAALMAGLSEAFRAPIFLAVTGVVGGVVLIWMAVAGLLKSNRDLDLGEITAPDVPRRKARTVIDGILTSLSNPYWFIWWATIGLVYLGRANRYGWFGVGSFYSGHILADLAWYSAISIAVAKGRRFIKPVAYRWLLKVCSLFLGGLGVYFICSGISFWMGG